MKCGFTYKNRHSSEFGIVAKTKSRPVIPEMKNFTAELPLKDGVYDFSESNEYGRAFYNDRFFELEIQVSAENLHSLEKKVSKIAVWLKGSGELIFDDMPFVKWRARVISELGFAPALRGKTTVMTAVFRVEPFSACIWNTADGPMLDSAFELDSNIPIGIDEVFTWTFEGSASEYRNVSYTLRVVNAGNVQVRPVVKITGTVKDITLERDGKELYINSSGNGFTVDFKNHTVKNLSGQNAIKYTVGNFFELDEVTCNIDVVLKAKGTVKIKVEYEPAFVYDYDFDDVDWSESNA